MASGAPAPVGSCSPCSGPPWPARRAAPCGLAAAGVQEPQPAPGPNERPATPKFCPFSALPVLALLYRPRPRAPCSTPPCRTGRRVAPAL